MKTPLVSNPEVSYFTNTTRPAIHIPSAPKDKEYIHVALSNGPIIKIFNSIASGLWSDHLEAIKANKGGYEKNKRKLHCFTPSGTFRIRNDWDILQYSQIVHLDYDSIEKPAVLRGRLVKSPYTLAAFISPSGKGVKVFVKVNTGPDQHQVAFTQVRNLFDDLAGVKSDGTCRNLSRLCYVSVDPGCYVNEQSEVFPVSPIKKSIVIPDAAILAGNSDGLFTFLFNLTAKGKFQGETFPAGYSNDHRNNFLFLFACNCNRYGVDKVTCLDYCKMVWVQNNEGFALQELGRSVDSAYSHSNEHASFRLPKHLAA